LHFGWLARILIGPFAIYDAMQKEFICMKSIISWSYAIVVAYGIVARTMHLSYGKPSTLHIVAPVLENRSPPKLERLITG
jgi:hypothetical protein